MAELLRYRQIRQYDNPTQCTFTTHFGAVGTNLTIQWNTMAKILDCVFAVWHGHWPRKNFVERSWTSGKKRSTTDTDAAKSDWFKILSNWLELSSGQLESYLVSLYLLHTKSFTMFQRQLPNEKDITWLTARERFMMLQTFQVWSEPSNVPTLGSHVQTKKMQWHLLRESVFSSTPKLFCDSDQSVSSRSLIKIGRSTWFRRQAGSKPSKCAYK